MFLRLRHCFAIGLLLLSLVSISGATIQAKQESKAVQPSVAPKAAVVETKQPINYLNVEAVELIKTPERYLDKPVRFSGVFNSFSALGLDYPKAERKSKEYISVLILRPDVDHHKIPLSELKLFYPRKKTKALLDLESGMKVTVKGTVFSTALGDPWVDINELTFKKKVKKASSS